MGKIFAVTVFWATCVCAADPATYTLKTSVNGVSFDWRDASNYEEGAAPSAGCYVKIPQGVNAVLSHGDEWWDFVSALGRIRPTTATSYFTVNIPEGVTNSLSCEISNTGANSGDSYDRGGLVKTGGGVLKLVLDQYGYHTAFTVNEGGLILALLAGKKNSIDSLYVAEGAFVDLQSDATLVTRWFSGEGNIGSTSGAILQTYTSDSRTSDYSGKLTGNLKLNSCSRVLLRNEESTKSGTVYILGEKNGARERGAVLGVAKVGNKDKAPSSAGTVNVMYFGQSSSASGGLLYLGAGETSDKDFTFRTHNKTSFSFVDGGANGGLELTGGLTINNDASAVNHRFGLCGSNVADCVLGMTITERADTNGNPVSYHIVKSGSGAWKIDPKPASTWAGAITVEEGTLKFDTLSEAGLFCSLGYATNLFKCYTGVFDENCRTNWAIALGTTGTCGTLQYTGDNGVICTTRPIAMQGDGRIVNDGPGRFSFCGITSAGDNEKTLVLGGDGMADNTVSGLDDSSGGAISVCKEGSGKWLLSVNSSFRGDVDVKAGTLAVMAPTNGYTWFRFTDMQVCTNRVDKETGVVNHSAPSSTFYMREMAFFNEEGVSQTIGLEYTADRCGVLPGQFAFGKEMTAASSSWNALFDDTAAFCSATLPAAPVMENESTWFPLVFRLPANADRIVSFDLAYNTSKSGDGARFHPLAFKIEGSVDGLVWTELFATNDVVSPGSGFWLSNAMSYSAGSLTQAMTNPTKRRHGISFGQPVFGNVLFDGVRTVSVASGATLESTGGRSSISSFRIDMSNGGGTVKGFEFAESGTISIVNVPASGGNLKTASFTPADCTGVENMSGWTLLVDGEANSKYSVKVASDGTVRLSSPAMRLIIR